MQCSPSLLYMDLLHGSSLHVPGCHCLPVTFSQSSIFDGMTSVQESIINLSYLIHCPLFIRWSNVKLGSLSVCLETARTIYGVSPGVKGQISLVSCCREDGQQSVILEPFSVLLEIKSGVLCQSLLLDHCCLMILAQRHLFLALSSCFSI